MDSAFGASLTFKGGTSLAKAYHAIGRFSEDLDITYDIRALSPELVSSGSDEGIPLTRSQERRWTRAIRQHLPYWVANDALPASRENFDKAGLKAQLRTDGENIFVAYEPLFTNYDFVKAEVKVEFGARSTGEPRKVILCGCDAADFVPDVAFPTVSPAVMLAERTFWEKATAIHVFCHQQRSRGERLSRHWYDLVMLDDAGYAEKALIDRSIALSVARHKRMFFREKDISGNWIDYLAAVSGCLQLVPDGVAYQVLADDYDKMLRDGMLLDNEQQYDALMERCEDIQIRVNSREQYTGKQSTKG